MKVEERRGKSYAQTKQFSRLFIVYGQVVQLAWASESSPMVCFSSTIKREEEAYKLDSIL